MKLALSVSQWFNTQAPIDAETLAGKIVILHAFQMLCPGCVSHGTPQAEKLHRMLRNRDDVAVIALHTVFEHHAAMTPVSLEAYIHEYRLTMPVGVDEPGANGTMPVTMARYQMRGTPSLLIFDRDSNLVHHGFGQEDDVAVGFILGTVLASSKST